MLKAIWNLSIPPLAVLASGMAMPLLAMSLKAQSSDISEHTFEPKNGVVSVSPVVSTCVDGRIEVTYESKAGPATIQIWSGGHPMTCDDQSLSRMQFGTINGRVLGISESQDIIYAAIHQHMIVRTAELHPVYHGPDHHSPIWNEHDKITAYSLAKTLQSISEVEIKNIDAQ